MTGRAMGALDYWALDTRALDNWALDTGALDNWALDTGALAVHPLPSTHPDPPPRRHSPILLSSRMTRLLGSRLRT
jgi:hypothetical protein